MAESTLAALYSTLRSRIGIKAGYTGTSSNWDSTQTSHIANILDSGIRQAYFPPALPGETVPHRWSFMTPTTTLDLFPSYSEDSTRLVNTATVNNAVTNNTGTTFYPAMVGRTITINSVDYTVASYVSATEIRLSSDPGNQTGKQWSITGGDYRLSDDFGQLVGDRIHFASDIGYSSMPVVSEPYIRQRRAVDFSGSGIPTYAAIIPAAPFSTSDGQRFDLIVYPIPGQVYTMNFKYHVLPNQLASDHRIYGGTPHAELFISSCLAACEKYFDDRRGVEWDDFLIRLQASVAYDRRNAPPTLGPMLGGPVGRSGEIADWTSRTFTLNGTDI